MKEAMRKVDEWVAITVAVLLGLFGIVFIIGWIGVVFWFVHKVAEKSFYLLDKFIDKI